MFKRSSLKWPIALGVLLSVLTIALLVFWIILGVQSAQWGLLVFGIIFLALILGGVVWYLVISVKEIALNRRQANFIDAVTHELKSPIASIKLYLQTLNLRQVPPEQQQEFHKFMLEDIQRLDTLIDHLLAVARLNAAKKPASVEEIPLHHTLARCAADVRARHQLDEEQIRVDVPPCVVMGHPPDLEMVFLNLIDNAVKYGDKVPQVVVTVQVAKPGRLVIRTSDNGPGVRFELRRKIFRRFYRGGSELERTTTGTGLGLYLVKVLLARMRGKVFVHQGGPLSGATFEVELPGRLLESPESPQVNADASQPSEQADTHA